MFKLATRAGQREIQGARQYRCGQFEGQSRLAADGNAQQSAVAAVRLKVVVLNPRVKRGCSRAVDTERKTCAFIPGQYCLLDLNAGDPLCAARANAMRPRRVIRASSVEAREKLAPVGRVMCKRGEDLARRPGHFDGGTKTDGRRVEEVKIDGFAGEHAILLAV